MPFNSSGLFERLYSWVADRNNGLKIRADRMDAEFDNFKSGMNDIVLGNAAMKGPVRAVFGSALNPAYTFADDPDSGLFHKPDGSIGVSVGGVEVGAFPASFFTGISDHLSATDDPHSIAPSTILTKLKTVDGAGSGVDADLLDGQHGSYFAPTNSPNFTGTPDVNDAKARTILFDNLEATNITADGMLGFDSSQGLKIYRTQGQGEAAGDGAYTVLDTANITGGANIDISDTAPGASGLEAITFSVNQGADSNLDADKLDGQEGAFYRNASNLNAGTIPAARLSGTYTITATSATNADKVDNIHASSFVRRDNVNNGTVTIRADDADFVVSDGTDGTPNFIWRDHSANKLNLGTANAVPTLRANLDMNGQNVVGDLVSQNANKIKSGAAYLENGHIVWEDGVNRITHNDGGGNVQIRFGNDYDDGEKFTHAGTAFYLGGSLDSANGTMQLKVASNGGAGNNQPVTWGRALDIQKDDVLFGGKRLVRSNWAQKHYATGKAYASATNLTLTDLNCTITPTRSTARILVIVNLTHDAYHDGMFYMLRNSTEIGSAPAAGSRTRGMAAINYDTDWATTLQTQTFMYVDHPNTTNAVTYKVGARFAASRVLYLNRTANDADANTRERGSSRVICMEI